MIKQIRIRKPVIGEQELLLTQSAATLQELIEQIVTINVQQYNNRTVDELWITAPPNCSGSPSYYPGSFPASAKLHNLVIFLNN
jgi:hypothetical protein